MAQITHDQAQKTLDAVNFWSRTILSNVGYAIDEIEKALTHAGEDVIDIEGMEPTPKEKLQEIRDDMVQFRDKTKVELGSLESKARLCL